MDREINNQNKHTSILNTNYRDRISNAISMNSMILTQSIKNANKLPSIAALSPIHVPTS